MKTKRTKKLVSLLLCVALLMSFLPLGSIMAYALSDEKITQVTVTITPPVVGSANATPVVVSAEPEKYTVVANGVWQDGGGNVATEFLSNGNVYKAMIEVTPQSGYALATDTTIVVNGEPLPQGGYLGGATDPASIFEYDCTATVLGTIDSITLENVPTGAVGTAATPYAYTGTNFTVSGAWECYDYTINNYKPMSSTDTFADGKLYRLALSVIPAVGYELEGNCSLRINGAFCENFNCTARQGNCWIDVSYVEQIHEIHLNKADIPEAKLGESFDAVLDVAVPAGSNYTAFGYWYTVGDMTQVTSGTFEKNKEYYFQVTIVPEEGYVFVQNAPVFVDGEHIWVGMNGVTEAYTSLRTSFKTAISKAELLDLPVAEVGKKLQTGVFSVSVPAGAKYTAEASWTAYDEENGYWMMVDETEGTDTVQAGKAYRLEVYVRVADGYEFTEYVILNAHGVDWKMYSMSYTDLYYEREFSFRKDIEKVQVTGVVQPQAGKDATVDGIKVPDDANYAIDYATWYDTADYSLVTQFQAGHDYELEITFVAKEGYCFTRKTQFLVNGEEPYGENVGDKDAYIYNQYSLKQTISEVNLKNVPQMQVGQTPKTDVQIPADAKYTALVEWFKWDEDREEYRPFTGTFAAGEIYALNIMVIANDGYRFDTAGTKALVNGQESSDFRFFGDRAVYTKEFATEQKTINRIELKVEKPVAGQHSSMDPVVTIVSGTGVVLDEENNMQCWIVGDVESNEYIYDFFTSDENYGISAGLKAQSGYCFAEDLVIVVNGAILPREAVGAGYKQTNLTYFFNMQSTEQEQGGSSSAVNGSDNQSDSAAPFLWAGVIVMSLAAFATCVWEKKRKMVG